MLSILKKHVTQIIILAALVLVQCILVVTGLIDLQFHDYNIFSGSTGTAFNIYLVFGQFVVLIYSMYLLVKHTQNKKVLELKSLLFINVALNIILVYLIFFASYLIANK